MSQPFPKQPKAAGCSQCTRNAEYYCRTCKQDLCIPCKEEHVIDFDTKHHDVVIDRLKYEDIMFLETCVIHPNIISEKWCLLCELPICSNCVEHIKHETQDIKLVYKNQQEQHQEMIIHVKSEIMLYNRVIQAGINSDFKSCQTEISKLQKKIINKAERLKRQIDVVVDYIKNLKSYNSKEKQQKRHITSIQKRVYRSEQLANRAIQFLVFSKKNSVFKKNDAPSTLIVNVHSFIGVNKDNVFNFLVGISITEPEKRQVRKEQLFKMMFPLRFQKRLTVKPSLPLEEWRYFISESSFNGINYCCHHISCVTTDAVWINSWGYLQMSDTSGRTLFDLQDRCFFDSVQTVTKEGNLLYIGRDYNINSLSFKNKTKSILMRIAEPWKPYCIYSTQSNGDLLIGMKRWDTSTAKVGRYNNEGQELQHNPGHRLYINPRYITENRNGDVIVSDLIDIDFKSYSDLFSKKSGVVVVTNHKGIHRFDYTGRTQELQFIPRGICTDALSHILICDTYTKTVQMIDKDGQFLAVLLTDKQGIYSPYSLSYDHKAHLLWVGSGKLLEIYVCRHINRHDYLSCDYKGR